MASMMHSSVQRTLVGRSVCLCWAKPKPKGPMTLINRRFEHILVIQRPACGMQSGSPGRRTTGRRALCGFTNHTVGFEGKSDQHMFGTSLHQFCLYQAMHHLYHMKVDVAGGSPGRRTKRREPYIYLPSFLWMPCELYRL